MDRLLNSRTGINLASSLGRAIPPWLGHTVASLAAGWISARRNSAPVRAVRCNQWVVAGKKATNEELTPAVRAVFQNSARSIYELNHYIQQPEKIGQLFVIEPSFQELVNRPEFDRRGVIIAGLHLISFDLALRWLCMKWIKPLALTITNPEGGRKLELETRQKAGMNVVPGSVSGMRQAIRQLKQGGMVLTGIDRPVTGLALRPRFFGLPACVPTHHIYLALKAQAPVVVAASRLEEDGKYHIHASHLIEMDLYPNHSDELVRNAEKVLAVAENFIRLAPQQWVMFLPLWPDVANQVPR